jgi:hypothetical protein
MENGTRSRSSYIGWVLGLVALVALTAVACGGPAANAEPGTQATIQPTSTVAIPNPTPTFTPVGASDATPVPDAQPTQAFKR